MGDANVLEAGQWWRKPFGMLQTNLREIDADMNVDEVVDFIEQHGATAWLISIGGIKAQYSTGLAFQSKNPNLAQRKSGDLILDAITAAHSRGMRLLARMDFSKITAQTATEHPDWTYVSPSGNLQEHTGELVSVCPSGGYYQEKIFEILDEVTSRYKLDGFFLNWTSMNEEDYYKRYHGVCHCSSCQTRWLEYSGGHDLPNGPNDANYAKWLSFGRDVIDALTARIRAFIAEKLPDACLILGKTADIMFHEANNAVGRELWHHATSEIVSTWSSYRPNVPTLVNSTTFMDMPYRMASEEPAHFAQYLLQCISRGGNPSTYMMGTPGKIPYLCMDMGKQIHKFHKKWTAVYDGMRPCSKTGLVRPDRAQMTGKQFEEGLSEYRGLYVAMQELHIPFDILGQEHLDAMAENGGLKRYNVLVLPNLGKLGSEAVALDEWVAAGGHLVATGSSGVGDGGAIQLKSLPAKHQRAVVSKRELLFSTYFAPPQDRSIHVYQGPIVPVYGSYHLFEWKTSTEGRYRMLARAPFSPPEKAYGNIQVDQHGSAVGHFGGGKGINIPFTVGRGYRELGLRAFRDFYAMILREDGGAKAPITCNIAEQVEMTLHVNGPKLIIHLINMSGARKQNFGSHLPISDGTIKVFVGKNITAHALSIDKTLEVKDREIILPVLDLFEVIVIEGV